eukprot:Rhum_TRINITY_DN21195_c0_g1::Rhum_TRINITY_DN21195_c0_g1_i1::g.173398::m.173398
MSSSLARRSLVYAHLAVATATALVFDECVLHPNEPPCGTGQRCQDPNPTESFIGDFFCMCEPPFHGEAIGKRADCVHPCDEHDCPPTEVCSLNQNGVPGCIPDPCATLTCTGNDTCQVDPATGRAACVATMPTD